MSWKPQVALEANPQRTGCGVVILNQRQHMATHSLAPMNIWNLEIVNYG